MPLPQWRAFIPRDNGRRISELVVRKLCGQSFGAVQQHHRSTSPCRSPRQDATVDSTLFLDGWIQQIVFSGQCWIARPPLFHYSRVSTSSTYDSRVSTKTVDASSIRLSAVAWRILAVLLQSMQSNCGVSCAEQERPIDPNPSMSNCQEYNDFS